MDRGFNLIELMVAVTVMLLLTGGGVVAINNFNSDQKVKATKSNLVTLLKEARQYAKNNQKPTTTSGADKCVTVVITNPPVAASIQSNISDHVYSTLQPFGDPEVTITGTLPCFAYFDTKLMDVGTTKFLDPTYTTTIVIKSSANGGSQSISINSLGVINE